MNWSSFGPVYFAIAPSEGAKTVNSLDKYCDASELCINKFLNWNLKQIDIEIFFEWFFSSNHKDQY